MTIASASTPRAATVPDTNYIQGVAVAYLSLLRSILPSVGRMSCSQFCQMYVSPRTSRSCGSVAEVLSEGDDTRGFVGEATWFVSHTWTNSFLDTLDAILLFFQGRNDAATAKIWIDVLVTPQITTSSCSKSSSFWMTSFTSNIARMGRLLLVVDVWNNPSALRRAWFALLPLAVSIH
jgi:hypothetical protein